MPFLPRKKILAVLWILNALFWSGSALVLWWLTQLQALAWLAVLPSRFAQISIALYLSPITPLSVCLLSAGVSLWLCWRGVPVGLVFLPALLMLGLSVVWGRIDTRGTSHYVFDAARRGNLNRTREQLLIHMARFGLLNEIQALLRAGTNVNAQDPRGGSALSWSSDPAIVKVLLNAGAKPDGATLVKTAFWGQQDIVKLLFRATPDGGRALVATAGDEALLTVASISTGGNAERAAIAQMLILRGANPNAKAPDGATALMQAALQHYPEVAQVLLRAGANPNTQDKAGDTALHQAVFHGLGSGKAVKTVKILLDSGADVNIQDSEGSTPLLSALEELQQVEEEARHASPNNQAFYRAIQQERITMIRLLIEAGANVTIPDHQGQTALDLATENSEENQEVIKILRQAKKMPGKS